MSVVEQRIRERAYRIWLEEGCPEGRELDHWDMATELVAIEDAQQSTLKPIDQNLGPDGEPIVLADDEAALVVVKLELMHRGSFGGLGMTQSVRQPGLCHYRGFGQGSAAQYAR